jgi:hypothetical protein
LRLIILAALAAFIFVSPAFANRAIAGSCDGSYCYALWANTPPITVKVDLSKVPATEIPILEQVMQDWSLSPSVDMVRGPGVKILFDDRCATACAVPNYNNGIIHGVTIHFNPILMLWTDQQWVYCHELGHALGFSDGADGTQYDSSCMTSIGENRLHPSQQNFDWLALMYPGVN